MIEQSQPNIDSAMLAELTAACYSVSLPPSLVQEVFAEVGAQYVYAEAADPGEPAAPDRVATHVMEFAFRAYIPSNPLDTTFPPTPGVWRLQPLSSTKYFLIDPRLCGNDGSSRVSVEGWCFTIDMGSNGIFTTPSPALGASAGASGEYDSSDGSVRYETSTVMVRRACRDTGTCESTGTARVTGVYPFVPFPLNAGNFLASVSCTFNIRFIALSPGVVMCDMWGNHTRFPSWDAVLTWDGQDHTEYCYTTPDQLPLPDGLSSGVDFQSAVVIVDFGGWTSPGCD